MNKKLEIMDAAQAEMKLKRIAYEIVENNIGQKEIVLAGIRENGVVVAEILRQHIKRISELKVDLITIQINKQHPIECAIETAFDASGKNIVMVDDVADSGKTMMYALRPFLQTIPASIQVAVLVDRKHKKYPITSDYTGLQLSTTLQENIRVECKDGKVVGAFVI